MTEKLYAILTTNHLNNGYTTLHNKVFSNEDDAKLEIKNLASIYIQKSVEKKRKAHLEYNENMLMINSKPTPNCMFAEISYYIQEVDVQQPLGIAADAKISKNPLVNYAKRELDLITKGIKKDKNFKNALFMQEEVNHEILDLIELFANQSHSGLSAPYVINRFKRLADWKPLIPLTGEDDEWMDIEDVLDKPMQQNIRYSGLFRVKGDNSTAHDVNANVFSDNGGVTWFTGSIDKDFRKPITFPYMPPSKPREIYIRWLDDEHEKYEVVESEEEKEKQRVKFRQEMKDSGWDE